MRIAKNVVEYLYVVHAKIGDGKYQFRVKAESEAVAREKAKKLMDLRNHEKAEVLSAEKIEPDDFIS